MVLRVLRPAGRCTRLTVIEDLANELGVGDVFDDAQLPTAERDDAACKLIWLALRNITADWHRSVHEWREVMNQFAIAYGDRFTRSIR